MKPRVLVVYHSVEGQAEKVAHRIADDLRSCALDVDLHAVDAAPAPAGYQGVVVGDSIHVVHHSKALTRYLRDHVEALNGMPSALFQVSMTSATADEEHTATAQGMVDELVSRTGFEPDTVGLFAGALAYTRYGWLKRMVMRHISKKEGGQTDTSRDWEYTDWDAVDRFAWAFAGRVDAAVLPVVLPIVKPR
jgi:menaquinone-dependent protoporphyrinogen oxidase